MALVHSRVRRVVFGIADEEMGGLGGAANSNSKHTGIHFLPGTNHHYRAFRLDTDSSDKYDEKTVELIESVTNLHRERCTKSEEHVLVGGFQWTICLWGGSEKESHTR